MTVFRFGAMFDSGPQFGPYAKLIEDSGFDTVYCIDSPIVWREMAPSLTQAALATTTLQLGACCTNPVSRNLVVNASFHASLHELSGGRVLLGIGKGDSALRRIGERQATLKEFKAGVLLLHQLANGEEITYQSERPGHEAWHAQGSDAVPVRFEWAIDTKMPLYIAGYGPKILAWAGQVADGVFVQIAEPKTVEWIVGNVKASAEAAGRDPSAIDFVCCVPTAVSDDLHAACDLTRGFPAFVANHVADLVRFTPKSQIPPEFLKCLEGHEKYDYRHHTDSTADHAATVSDELAEAYTVVGTAQACLEKIKRLEQIGITQLCIYFLGYTDDQIRSTVEAYSDTIMPRMA